MQLYIARHKYNEAEQLIKEAISTDERVFGPDHPQLIKPLIAYAILLRRTGRESDATAVEDRIKRIRVRVAAKSEAVPQGASSR